MAASVRSLALSVPVTSFHACQGIHCSPQPASTAAVGCGGRPDAVVGMPQGTAVAATSGGRHRRRSWQSQLPSPWAIREPSGLELWPATDRAPVDLVAINDGWLASVAPNRLQPIQAEPLEQQLGGTARRYLQQLGADQTGRVLPVGVSPWVMLFRNGSQWLDAARQGWDVLLEPDLQGKVVLPASPRFVIELADRMSSDAALLRLRGH